MSFLSFSLPNLQAFTSTAVKNGGLSAGDVGALYKYKNVMADVKLHTESSVGLLFLYGFLTFMIV